MTLRRAAGGPPPDARLAERPAPPGPAVRDAPWPRPRPDDESGVPATPIARVAVPSPAGPRDPSLGDPGPGDPGPGATTPLWTRPAAPPPPRGPGEPVAPALTADPALPDDPDPDDPDPDDPDDADAADQAAVAAGWELVAAAQEGNRDAFGRLYDRYHRQVYRFVLYRLGDHAVAEDLTQETFVRAWRRLSSVRYQGRDIGAWFVTIARNLVLDHVKSSRYRLESATPEFTDVAPTDAAPGPEHEVLTGITHAELLRCVRQLGGDQQECVILRFLQGLSVSETAVIMNRNEGAVKALQHRAVRRLAQLMPVELR